MCINASVGHGGSNHRADAKVVQALLNENLYRLIPYAPLEVDGAPGNHTNDVISEFQRRVVKIPPTGKVEPNSPTLRALRAGMSPDLTINKLRAIMTDATPAQAQRYFAQLSTNMVVARITLGLRMAHFLAQLGHESGDLRYSEEIASGSAYEGRADLGNTQPGDGVRFKGRGLIQLTGRANYTAYGTARHRDFVTEPNNRLLATEANSAVDVSCWFWNTHNLNTLADANDINGITRRINGGLNGLADRTAHFERHGACWYPSLLVVASLGAGCSQRPSQPAEKEKLTAVASSPEAKDVRDCRPCSFSPGGGKPVYTFRFDWETTASGRIVRGIDIVTSGRRPSNVWSRRTWIRSERRRTSSSAAPTWISTDIRT